MLLVQAMAKQLQAPKLADHLAYMVAEAANKAPTLEHTFTEAGEYPYFCLLHPNMVGTVSVS
jgi:plastocyanin